MNPSSSTLALTRKYRPQKFLGVDGLVGQDTTAQSLRRAVQNGSVKQAYLLVGKHGIGKTTIARVLAAALNCPQRSEDAEPCGNCDSCSRITRGKETLDVVEMDAASNRGVDNARDLRQQAMYAPSEEGRWKVYIIDEAHMLTRDAWNALLKVLEEPPARTVFVFATTEPDKIQSAASPVLSRMVRFNLNQITAEAVAAHLGQIAALEGMKVEPEVLAQIAQKTKGSMRDALRDLDDLRSFVEPGKPITTADFHTRFGAIPEKWQILTLDVLAGRSRARVFSLEGHLHREGADCHKFFQTFLKTLHDLHMVKEGVSLEGWSEEGYGELNKRAPLFSPEQITACIRLGLSMNSDFQGDNPPNLVLNVFFQEAITLLGPLAPTDA